MPEANSLSAHELRVHYREQQATAARLRLLHAGAGVLAELDGADAARALLTLALDFCAFDGGAVLVDEQGALRILAARGEVMPAGMRMPAQGAHASLLKPDATLLLRENSVSRLLLPAGALAGVELMLPLRAAGRPVGILQLASRRPVAAPAAPDLQALSTLAGMLALLVRQPAQSAAARVPPAGPLVPLTPREREVLGFLPHGLTNADIAVRLGIATGTVKVHVERIIHKFGLSDRTQVAARAVELGFGTSGADAA